MSGRALVLAAMPRELRPLVRRLGLRPTKLGGVPAWGREDVIASAVGVGPALAGAGTALVLEEVAPDSVLVTGVAGALDASLRVGDTLRPARVVDVRTGTVFTPSRGRGGTGVLATVERMPLVGTGPAGHSTTPPIPDEATAVDMETAAIAAVCEARAVPWGVVRAISDVAGTLTPRIASLLLPDGRADIPGAVRMVLADPRTLGRLVRLGRDAARAARAVTGEVMVELELVTTRDLRRRDDRGNVDLDQQPGS